jgi:hypothetical protein
MPDACLCGLVSIPRKGYTLIEIGFSKPPAGDGVIFNEFAEQVTGRTPDEAQRRNLPSYPDKTLL